MRNLLRKWLGIRDLEDRIGQVSAVAEARMDVLWNAVKTHAPIALKTEPEITDDALPMEIEAAVGRWWFDQPQAAQSTRTYARGLMGKGMHPEQIARRIAENGVVIE